MTTAAVGREVLESGQSGRGHGDPFRYPARCPARNEGHAGKSSAELLVGTYLQVKLKPQDDIRSSK